jgi:hypothetical protein
MSSRRQNFGADGAIHTARLAGHRAVRGCLATPDAAPRHDDRPFLMEPLGRRPQGRDKLGRMVLYVTWQWLDR